MIVSALVIIPVLLFSPPTCDEWDVSEWKSCESACWTLGKEDGVCSEGICYCCMAGECWPFGEDPDDAI